MEYLYGYGPLTYQMATQMLTLGLAVMLTAQLYLVLNRRTAGLRYRPALVRAR
jgi:hypothetical protein